MTAVPVVVLDHLTPEQRRAYVLADNKLAENAGWDLQRLNAELGDLLAAEFNIGALGFDDEDLKRLEDGLELGQFEELSQGFERAEPEDQPGLGLSGAGEDDGPDDATAESGEVEERHVFSVNLLWDDREVVLAAVRAMKERRGLEGTPEALVMICREWLDEREG
jgi:ParB-like chromosome segregation protein Spo0J